MKINLITEAFRSSDVSERLSDWLPEDAEDIYIGVEFHVGPALPNGKPERGEMHMYQTLIATTKGIDRHEKIYGSKPKSVSVVIAARPLLVVRNFDWKKIEQHIIKTVKSCESNSLDETRWKLQRHYLWQYEDFIKPTDQVS